MQLGSAWRLRAFHDVSGDREHALRRQISDLVSLSGVGDAFDTEPRVAGRDDEWLSERNLERHPVMVAEIDDRVVGWVSLNPWSSRAAYARTAEGSVYVDRDFRGRGLGRSLLATTIERARAAGLGVLLARIAEANEPSVRLFESLGFGRIGSQRRCGEKLGRILDVELMDLHLDGG